MQRIGRNELSADEITALSAFLSSPARPDGTLTLHQLQGFLFAVACSPELITPSEWLPIISNDEDMLYEDVDEARRVLGQIMAMYNQVNASALGRSDAMPVGCEFLADTDANFDEQAPVSQWSRGFALGHDWIREAWDEYVPDDHSEMSQELAACLMTLSFFSSRQIAEAFHRASRGGRRRAQRKSFNQFAEMMRKLFPSALASYAHLGRTISEVLVSDDDSRKQPTHD
jgi:yecA family protein